jgi:hypothetical protein
MASMIEYEYRVMTFGRQVSREEARRALVEAAEHGDWELTRTRHYVGGARRSWLRRKMVRVPRALVDAVRA